MNSATSPEKETRTPICCPVLPGKVLARIDIERSVLFLWCKGCRRWHDYDLEVQGKTSVSTSTVIA